MDASRPLLAGDTSDEEELGARSPDCLSRYLSAGNSTNLTNGKTLSNGHTGNDHTPYFASSDGKEDLDEDNRPLCCRPCSQWPCWKWVFPDRIGDYEDFATSAQMGEIYALRQTRVSNSNRRCQDDDMLQHLWSGLFPTLPYEGRVNVRWRDVGFQVRWISTMDSLVSNDDPASDLRTSGRLAIRMLLYFSDHLNDEFKRMVRENRFPVCLCALNLLEMLLCHLKLKEPLPLICPCCGTENAELETSQQPSRTDGDASSLASSAFSHQLACAEGGPAEIALAHVFAHSLLVMDAVWKQQLQRDPTTTLMHFREALVETRVRIVAFLSRRRMPLTLAELDVWATGNEHVAAVSARRRHKSRSIRQFLY
ncbi:ELMO domain [Phytophthora cactorum]|nr:ELMO domain [Phytophthora cactorum]